MIRQSFLRNIEARSVALLFVIAIGIPTLPSARGDTLHEQWCDFAPYMSMDVAFRLEEVTPAWVAKKVELCVEAKSKRIDDPLLREVAYPFLDFLIQIETTIIPTLRAKELSIEGLAAELLSRALEQEFINQLQLRYDRRCRSDYAQLMPIARRVAGPESSSPPAIGVMLHDTDTSIANQSGRSLTNVTLAVEYKDFFGNIGAHYYFLPHWGDGERFSARITPDWFPALQATTKVRIEVVADQMRHKPTVFHFEENKRRFMSTFLESARRLIDRDPKAALDRLEAFRAKLPADSPLLDETKQLIVKAKSAVDADTSRRARITLLQNQIRKAEADRSKQWQKMMKANTPKQRERIRKQIQRIEKRIAKLKDSLNKLRR